MTDQAGEPVGFRAEVQRLRRLKRSGHPVPAPPLGPFPVYADVDPDDDVALYVDLLATYPFEPPLSYREKLEPAVDAVLVHGGSYAARAMSLALGTGAVPYTVTDVLALVARRTLSTPHEIDQAGWLVDYLLDDLALVDEVMDALWRWPRRTDLADVLRDEAARLPPDLVP